MIDAITRGGDVFFQFICLAWKSGTYTPFYPFGTLGTLATPSLPIGRLHSALAQAFVLTALSNTPAASAPASVTATALLAPNYSAKLLFNSKLRTVPVRLQSLPQNSSGTITWWA